MSIYACYHITYSGMVIPRTSGTHKECQDSAKKKLAYAEKNGWPWSKLDNNRWEIETPDTAFCISDFEGFLCVKRLKDSPKEVQQTYGSE